MPDLLAHAVRQIVELAPDLFVLTGDLLDYPLDRLADHALQRQAGDDLQLIARLLEPLTCPMALVYGNHDHPDLYRQVFGFLSQDQDVCGHRILTFLDEEGEDNTPVRIGAERRRFGEAVTNAGSAPQIHVQHYVVWPERNQDYPHTYGDGASLRRQINASGNVKLVLSGHYHQGVEPFFDKGTWFSTVRAFGEAPHPFWVYELCADEFTWKQHTPDPPRRNA